MAHFCQLDADNIVTQVIVVDNKEIADPHTGEEDEILGIAFCKKLLGGKWVQTSYNGSIRKRYAGIGYSYNAALDAFIAPKPFSSWVLNNESAEWEAPTAQPTLTKKQQDAGSFYTWDEETTSWKLETKTV